MNKLTHSCQLCRLRCVSGRSDRCKHNGRDVFHRHQSLPWSQYHRLACKPHQTFHHQTDISVHSRSEPFADQNGIDLEQQHVRESMTIQSAWGNCNLVKLIETGCGHVLFLRSTKYNHQHHRTFLDRTTMRNIKRLADGDFISCSAKQMKKHWMKIPLTKRNIFERMQCISCKLLISLDSLYGKFLFKRKNMLFFFFYWIVTDRWNEWNWIVNFEWFTFIWIANMYQPWVPLQLQPEQRVCYFIVVVVVSFLNCYYECIFLCCQWAAFIHCWCE